MFSSFSQTNLSTKRTKEELESYKRMTQYMIWEDLMKKAKKDKSTYLKLKAIATEGLSDENKKALISLIDLHKKGALKYYNQAEELKEKYPFIKDMINKKL